MIQINVPNVGWVDFDLRPNDIRMVERKHGCILPKIEMTEILEDLGWLGLKRSGKVNKEDVTMPNISYADVLELFLLPCRCVLAGTTLAEGKDVLLKAARQLPGVTDTAIEMLCKQFDEKRREKPNNASE